MEPILSKQEIADLLSTLQHQPQAGGAAVDSGRFTDSSMYDEVNLFHRYGDRREPDALPNFELIMDLFGEYYSTALSRDLQCRIEVVAVSVTYQRFSTYIASDPPSGAIGVMKAAPLKYRGLVTFNSYLAFSLIELMLGGSPGSESQQPDRMATKIELSILESVMQSACHAFQQALMPVVPISAELVKTVHDRRLVSLYGQDTELLVCTLQVQAEHFSDSMQLVYPINTFSPYLESLENLLEIDGQENNSWLDPISATIGSTTCEVMAQADLIDMTIRDLIALQAGDLLTLNRNPLGSVDLLVEGKKKFSGLQFLQDHKRHIRITDISV